MEETLQQGEETFGFSSISLKSQKQGIVERERDTVSNNEESF